MWDTHIPSYPHTPPPHPKKFCVNYGIFSHTKMPKTAIIMQIMTLPMKDLRVSQHFVFCSRCLTYNGYRVLNESRKKISRVDLGLALWLVLAFWPICDKLPIMVLLTSPLTWVIKGQQNSCRLSAELLDRLVTHVKFNYLLLYHYREI